MSLIRLRRPHPGAPMELYQMRGGVETVQILDLGQAWTLWADLSQALLPTSVISLLRDSGNTKGPGGKSTGGPLTTTTLNSPASANGRVRASR